MEVPSVTGIPLLLVETESQANKHGFHGHLLVPLVNHMLVPLVNEFPEPAIDREQRERPEIFFLSFKRPW